jgi:hypothetical protein
MTFLITDEAAQVAATGKTSDEMIDALQRNPDDAHRALSDNPSVQMILAQQKGLAGMAAKLGGAMAETVADITGIMANAVSNNPEAVKQWKEGGIYHTALSVAATALTVEHHNGEGVGAALAMYANILAKGDIEDFSKKVASEMGKNEKESMKKIIENVISSSIKQGLASAFTGVSSSGPNVITPKK